MAFAVIYVVKENEAGAYATFRQVLGEDGVTVVSEAEAPMLEVRLAAPEVLAQYFDAIAARLRATADHLDSIDGVDSLPSDITRDLCGLSYKAMDHVLGTFDSSLLPPALG